MILKPLLIFAIWQVVGLATWLRVALTVVLGVSLILQIAVNICKILAKREENAIKKLEQMTNNKEYSK